MRKNKYKKERRKKTMSTSSDSAEEMVRLSLEGFEVVAKLTGSMAKEVAVMLYAMSKERNEHKTGKVGLNKMLKSKGSFKIFSIKKENLEDFKKGAKKYKIPYSAIYLKGNVNKDGVIDIVVKEDDAVLVNRIVENYNLTTVEQSKLDEVIEKAEKENLTQAPKEKAEIQKEIQEKNTSQDLLNKLMKKQNNKEENENTNPSNIPVTEKEVPSENLSKANEKTEGTKKEEKPSIMEKLDTIKKQREEKEQQKAKEETKETPKQEKSKETKHKQPKKKNRKKERSK